VVPHRWPPQGYIPGGPHQMVSCRVFKQLGLVQEGHSRRTNQDPPWGPLHGFPSRMSHQWGPLRVPYRCSVPGFFLYGALSRGTLNGSPPGGPPMGSPRWFTRCLPRRLRESGPSIRLLQGWSPSGCPQAGFPRDDTPRGIPQGVCPKGLPGWSQTGVPHGDLRWGSRSWCPLVGLTWVIPHGGSPSMVHQGAYPKGVSQCGPPGGPARCFPKGHPPWWIPKGLSTK
jgi:hypothetical protein